MKNKTHIFFQEYESPKRFSYGLSKKKFSDQEVERIISMLPKNDKVIRIVWADPSEYIARRKMRELQNGIDIKD